MPNRFEGSWSLSFQALPFEGYQSPFTYIPVCMQLIHACQRLTQCDIERCICVGMVDVATVMAHEFFAYYHSAFMDYHFLIALFIKSIRSSNRSPSTTSIKRQKTLNKYMYLDSILVALFFLFCFHFIPLFHLLFLLGLIFCYCNNIRQY